MTGIAQLQHRFALPVEELWALIGDFGQVGRWSGRPPEACVQEGEGIGALRTLTLDDGRQVVDRLEAQGDRFYSYSIVSSPFPVKSYAATMSVASVDARTSELTWRGTVEPDGISDEQGAALFESMYKYGVGLIERQIARMQQPDGIGPAGRAE